MTVLHHSDDALEAVGDLAEQVFQDLDVEATRSPAYSNEAVSDEHDRRLWRTLADTGLLAAVKAYQTQHSLTADGVVGDRTWWTPAGGAGATLASLSELTTV